jgi:hypothetical protein
MRVMVRDRGGEWRSLDTGSYSDESHLQKLLLREPRLIDLKTPLLACVPEFGIPGAGSLDLLGVDEAAGVTLVECKLAKNHEVKREVVGQVLEYAAFPSLMPVDEFVRRFDTLAERQLETAVTDKGLDWAGFEEGLAENLRTGSFNLVVAVDHINDQLRKSLLFLNAHTDFTVAALELEYIADDEVEVLIPQLHGGEVDKEAAGRSASPVRMHWDERSFFAEVEKLDGERRRLVEDLYEFTRREADELTWGTGKNGAYVFRVKRAVFAVYASGDIRVLPGNFWDVDQDAVAEFRDRISVITGKDFSQVESAWVSMSFLADGEKMRQFKEAVLWFKGRIESSL